MSFKETASRIKVKSKRVIYLSIYSIRYILAFTLLCINLQFYNVFRR